MNETDALAWVTRLRGRLRLDEWGVEVVAFDRATEPAKVIIEREKLQAVFWYDGEIDPPDMRRHLAHEVLHLLFADMDFVACNGRSVDIMEIYNLFEERACNALSEILA